MRTLPAIAPTAPQVDDDQVVPEELVGRLYRSGESAVLDLLGGLTATERANLAMFCYRKAHLHRTGLAIAATCDLDTLVQAWGTALGHALFSQSRDRTAEPSRIAVSRRARITLARGTEFTRVAPGIVPDDLDDDLDDVDLDQADLDQADEGNEAVDLAALADPADAAIISAIDPV